MQVLNQQVVEVSEAVDLVGFAELCKGYHQPVEKIVI
jgi:hypothetical protein